MSDDFSEHVSETVNIEETVHEDTRNDDSFVVAPNIALALVVGVGKSLLLIGMMAASLVMVLRISEENPFSVVFETVGVSDVFVLKILIGVACAYVVFSFVTALSDSQNKIRFADGNIAWSEGRFLRRDVVAPKTALSKVNFKKYSFVSAGELSVELSGTETQSIGLSFVDDVEHVAARLQDMIMESQEKSR